MHEIFNESESENRRVLRRSEETSCGIKARACQTFYTDCASSLSVHTSTHNSHASSPQLGSYSAPTHNTMGLREWRRVCACVSVMNRASGILLVLLYTAGLRARSLVKSASQVLSRFSKEMTLKHHRKCYRQNDLLCPGVDGAGREWMGG